MFKYQCPECETVMKRALKVPEGKKIRCPKCEVIFPAIPLDGNKSDDADKKASKALSKKAVPAVDEDEEEGGTYTVVDEKPETAEETKRKEINFGSIRDKYPKSKRGPAMGKTVTPSTYIMGAGILAAVGAIIFLCYSLWPFIFREEPPKGKEATKRALMIAGAIVWFVYAALICHGASKMHTLESYGWAMAAAIMSTVVLIGIYGIVTLRDEEVVEGFEETASQTVEY